MYTEDGSRLIVRVPTLSLSAERRAALTRGAKLYISFESRVMHFFGPDGINLLTDLKNVRSATSSGDR